MEVLNDQLTTLFVCFSIPYQENGVVFRLNSQFLWSKKKKIGNQWLYLIHADIEGKPIEQKIWIEESYLVLETEKRPLMKYSFGEITHAVPYKDNGEEYLLAPGRTFGKGMTDEFGYLRINEGYYAPPST